MPPVAEPEAQRLTLADFNGPGTPADDYVQPPSKGGEAPPVPKVDTPAKDEPVISPLVEDDTPEPDPEKPAKPADDEPERTLSDSMEDPQEVAKQEAAAKKAKEKEEADAAAKLATQTEDDKKKAAEASAQEQRDVDLKYEPGAHTHPKTRTVITKFQAAAKAARDERDRERAERATEVATLKKERDEATEKAKATTLPKDAEDELKTLRERVRELDITQDPIIQKKYDARITSNNDTIINTLKAQGFGKVKKEGSEEFVDNPQAIAKLVKDGLTLKTLKPMIDALEKADLIEEAETVREALRENYRIARDKQAEIESWKGDHARRQQERESTTKQQREQQGAAFRQHTDTMLKTDLDALAKDFSYINRPPDPLPTDVPATVKAKQAAIAEYDAAAKEIEEAVKGLNMDGVTPEKLAEKVGRINANAIKAIVLEKKILPRVKAELAAGKARIAELEKELNGIREAGNLSRRHSAPSSENANLGPQPKTLEEAFSPPPGV